jgi:capsular exopolysaccharide synthesis family protein
MENKIDPRTDTPENDVIDIRELIKKYLRNWHWFVISVVFCFIVAFLYLKIIHNKYQVQTTILLRNQNSTPELSNLNMFNGIGMLGVSKEVEDEIQVLSSKTLVRQVIDSLNLGTEYYLKNGLRYDEVYPVSPVHIFVSKNFNDTLKHKVILVLSPTSKGYDISFQYGETIEEEYRVSNLSAPLSTPVGSIHFYVNSPLKSGQKLKIIAYPLAALTNQMAASISVATVNKNSNAISISTVSPTPQKAKAMLDKLVELYNLDAIFDKNMILTNTADFIESRLRLISSELLDVELNVENYKKSHGLTDISSEAQLYLETASEYEKKLADIETQLNLVNYIESYINESKNQFNLIPANLGIKDDALQRLIEEYNTALLERMKILRSSNDQNPVISQMEQQIRAIRGNIVKSIASVKDGLVISKNDLMAQNNEFTSKIKGVPTQERQFMEIKRQQQIKESLYVFLLQKREENALNLASTTPSARTIDAAYTSGSPVSPKRMIVFLLALILGLGLPVLVMYIMEFLNDTVQDRKEFQKFVKAPFLGSIGLSKETESIVVKEGRTTSIVEMFRLVRSNLQFMFSDVKSPVILVTSTTSGEGKTFIAANLAMSFALMKKKVILIGVDIRNPMLDVYFNIKKSNKGLTIFLADPNCQMNEIIQPSEVHPYLDIILAGPVPPNPAELLMNQRLDELIRELKSRYDYIILDSAPIGIVSDTFQLNRLVDNTICVARLKYTPKEALHFINHIYESKKLKNMATVLNGTNDVSHYGYGYKSEKKYKYRYRETAQNALEKRLNKLKKNK